MRNEKWRMHNRCGEIKKPEVMIEGRLSEIQPHGLKFVIGTVKIRYLACGGWLTEKGRNTFIRTKMERKIQLRNRRWVASDGRSWFISRKQEENTGEIGNKNQGSCFGRKS